MKKLIVMDELYKLMLLEEWVWVDEEKGEVAEVDLVLPQLNPHYEFQLKPRNRRINQHEVAKALHIASNLDCSIHQVLTLWAAHNFGPIECKVVDAVVDLPFPNKK